MKKPNPRLPGARAVLATAVMAVLSALVLPSALAQDRIAPLNVHVGERAPAFALPAGGGGSVRLADYAGQNVLIDFYRGYWCPYCMGELAQIVRHAPEFKALHVQILAISIDPLDKALWARRKLKASFPFLSDAQAKVQSLYGTRSPEFRNPSGVSVNTPTLVLVDRRGVIRWIHQAQSYKKRSPVAADLAQARRLN